MNEYKSKWEAYQKDQKLNVTIRILNFIPMGHKICMYVWCTYYTAAESATLQMKLALTICVHFNFSLTLPVRSGYRTHHVKCILIELSIYSMRLLSTVTQLFIFQFLITFSFKIYESKIWKRRKTQNWYTLLSICVLLYGNVWIWSIYNDITFYILCKKV